MATNLQTDPGPGLGELVSGIVRDAQELITQQLMLFKKEVHQDLQKAREGAGFLTLAAGALLVGSLLLGLMLVHLLAWLAPSLPLWACYGLVGGALAGVGGFLALHGREKLERALPQQTAKAMEENLEWKTKPT